MMTRETLYDAITEVKDELIVEAGEAKPVKSRVRWLKFGSIAAAVALIVGLGAGVFNGKIPVLPIGGNDSHEGHSPHDPTGGNDVGFPDNDPICGEEFIFMSYAGPVFPLTTVEGGEGLTAERAVTYDFQHWMDGTIRPYGGLPTRDTYILTNPTGEDREVTLLYPFVSNLYALSDDLPALTADGEGLNAELLTGQYSQLGGGRSGGLPSLNQAESWAEYRSLLSDGRYQSGALGEWPDLSNIPVTVYEIADPWVAEDAGGSNPTLHAAFELNYAKTRVLSYGFHGGAFDLNNGTMRLSFTVPRPPAPDSSIDPGFYETERTMPRNIIVIGEPVTGFQLLGTYDGAPESTDYMEWGTEIGAGLRQYETDLETALRARAEWMYSERSWNGVMDFELYFGMMKDYLLDTGLPNKDPEDRYDLNMLEELDYYAFERVFYLKARLTVPAGESVTVEANFLKKASFDYYCASAKDRDVCGYDLVTRLGTNLSFTEQTAAAVNTDGVEIVRQNFGFDWENGVNTVTLDEAEEHYYLEVRRTGRF